ncbi:MAG: lipopolysaccharide biosynthesis protein [Deltaproteobacteria bacterium]|nr:MAG: lipopolysaccharide biosynthesis protein [Deltaproteobacteria bacterium]
MDLKERTLRSTYWLFLTRVVFQGVSWGVTLVVARLLSPADYGLMGMAMIYIGFVELMSELGFGPALVQRKELEEEALSGVFWTTIAFSLGMIGLTYLLSPLLARFFKEPLVSPLIRLLSCAFLISALKVLPYNLLTRDLRLDRRSQAEIAGNLTASCVTLILALCGAGIMSLIAGVLVQNLVMTVMLLVAVPIPVNRPPDLRRIYPLLRFGFYITLSRILWYFRVRIDHFLGGRYLDSKTFGYYTVAVEFASLPIGKFNDIIKQVTFPLLSRLQGDDEAFRETFLRINRLTSLSIFPAAIGLAVVARPFVRLFLTEKWIEAVLPLQVFCVVVAIRNIVTLVPLILNARGKPDDTLKLEICQTVVLGVAFWIGVQWGLVGLSLSWLAAYPLISCIWFLVAARLLEVSLGAYLRTLWPATAATLLMALSAAAVVHWVRPLWLELALAVLTGAVVYVVAIRICFPAVFQEVWRLGVETWRKRKGG